MDVNVQLKKYKWKWIAICNKINTKENGRECAIESAN